MRKTNTTKEPYSDIVTYTPAKAKAILEAAERAYAMNPSMTSNRVLRREYIDKYKNALNIKAWKVNGESIKFDKEGILLDGQHRLTACVETGIPFRSVTAYNIDRDDCMASIDCGRARTGTDVQKMHKVIYPNLTQGIVRGVHNLCASGKLDGKHSALNAFEIHTIYSEDAENYLKAIEDTKAFVSRKLLSHQELGILH